MKNLTDDKNRRVLVIDDNRAIHEDFRKILSPATAQATATDATEAAVFGPSMTALPQARFEVDSAYQGQEGVRLAAKALEARRPYALAFVDVRMPPGWDGVETTRKLWELDPNLQVVICTAYSDYSWGEMFEKLGQQDGLLILKKPFDAVEALQLAHALTEKWWLHQQSRRKMEDLEEMVAGRTAELAGTNKALQVEIAGHKRAEGARHRAEQRYRTLVETARDFIFTISSQGIVTSFNPEFFAATGWTPDECVGQSYDRLVQAGDLPRAQELFRRALHGEVLPVFELRLNRRDGGPMPTEFTITSRTESGKIVELLGIGRDITERKRAEEAMQRSEERFRIAAETANDVIYEWDLKQSLAWLGKIDELLGYEPGEFPRTMDAFVASMHPEDSERTMAAIQAHLEGRGPFAIEYRVRRKDGVYRWWSARGAVACTSEGTPTRWIGSITDITERKQAEESLQQKAALLEAQMDSSIEGILVVDREGNKILQNRRVADLFKIPPDIALGNDDAAQVRWVTNTIRDSEPFGEKVVYLYAHPDEISRDEIELKNGTILDRYSAPVVGKDGSNYGRIWMFRDITERKQAEAVLRQRVKLQDQLVHIAAAVPGMIYSLRLRPDGSIQMPYASGALSEIFDLQPGDVIENAAPVFALIHPDDLGHVQATMAESARTLNPWRDEFRARHARLGEIWVEGHSVPQREPDGSILWHGFIQDITGRRQTELALRKSQALYHSLVEQLPAGVFRKNAAGRYVYVNPWFCRIKGVKAEVFLDKTPPETSVIEGALNGPNVAQIGQLTTKAVEHHRQIMETGRPIEIEEHGYGPDGKKQWLSVLKTPIFDLDGKIIGSQGIMFDITERKQAEEKLGLFRALIERSSDGIFVMDPATGRFLDTNESACRSLGYTRDELLALTVLEVTEVTEGMNRKMFEAGNTRLEKEGHAMVEALHRRKDGTTYPIEVSLSFVTLDRKYLVAIVRDITERKRAAETLEKTSALLLSLLQNTNDLIYFKDRESCFVQFSQAMLKHFHLTRPDELMGRTDFNFYSEEHARPAFEAEQEIIRTGEPILNVEEKETHRDGRINWVLTSKMPWRDQADNIIGTMGISRDITGRKLMEERLQESQKLETVGKLAGGIAHEFNSILTAIIGRSELLLQDLPAGSPLTENAAEITKAASRAATLTRQLLAYGRKQMLQPEILDLNQVIAGMDDVLRHLMGRETVAVNFVPAPGPHLVKVDAGQMEQVIINLAMNAREAMPNGGKLTLEITRVSFDQESVGRYPELKPGDYVLLAISDTGRGMSEAVKARAFEPFFTTKDVGQGTGLGLSTCYGIIKQSGGHISVYSEPGRGTTFKVYLPEVAAPAKVPVQRLDSPDLPRGTETILLVEDDPALRDMAATLLRRLGYTVLAAANGVEALSLSHGPDAGHMDLLFTDVVMPHMSGKELADRVRVLYPRTKILFTSAYTENAIVHQGVLDKGVALLQKPFTPSALARKVREMLDQPG